MDRSQARRTGGAEARRGGQKKSRRGFAAMSPEQQREIARKGGQTVSKNRRHMADIGRIGGEHSHGGRRARARR
jgi:general stress protein YciG